MARRKGGQVFLWIIMGLLAIGLVGFGTGNVGGSRTARIGTVGGLDVTAQDYANAISRQVRSISEQLGQTLTPEQVRELGIDRQVLAALVTRRTLDAEAARLGLSVGDARVAEAIRATPGFQGISGDFDPALYRDQLSRLGLDVRDYETSLREDTARALLQAAIVGGLPRPDAAAGALAAWRGERRTVTWAELRAETLAPTLPEPTPEDLAAWYEANPERYTAPETRSISYAWVTPEMIQDGLEVDEAEVQALYDERRADFVQEERRLVERLVLQDDEAADAARARIDSGEISFEDLVEERGLRLSDIDLGDVTRGELGQAADAVFAAAPGDVVGPVPTDLGPALVRVNAVLAADEVTFEEAAPDLRQELANEAARRAISDEVGRIEDLVAGGATVEDVAEQTLLELGTIDWSEGATDGPAAYEAFRSAAAAATEDAFPEVVPLEDGGAFVLRLDSVTPPAVRPYEEVAGEVEDDFREDAIRSAALASAEASAEAIAGGASFEDQALRPVAEEPRTRQDVIEGAPQGTVEAAFGLQVGQAIALPSPNGAVVIRLDAVAPAPEDDDTVAAEEDALARQISTEMTQDLAEAFARRLQADTEVRIDDAAVAAVNAQLQ